MAINLSKTFTIFDDNFKCVLHYNNKESININREFTFNQQSREYTLVFPNDFNVSEIYDELRETSNYRSEFKKIDGKLYVSEFPLKSSKMVSNYIQEVKVYSLIHSLVIGLMTISMLICMATLMSILLISLKRI